MGPDAESKRDRARERACEAYIAAVTLAQVDPTGPNTKARDLLFRGFVLLAEGKEPEC